MTGSGGSAGMTATNGMQERDTATVMEMVAADEAAMIGLGAALAGVVLVEGAGVLGDRVQFATQG